MLAEGETDEETAKLQADIELVKGLIEKERAEQGIKKDLANGEALNIECIKKDRPRGFEFSADVCVERNGRNEAIRPVAHQSA